MILFLIYIQVDDNGNNSNDTGNSYFVHVVNFDVNF